MIAPEDVDALVDKVSDLQRQLATSQQQAAEAGARVEGMRDGLLKVACSLHLSHVYEGRFVPPMSECPHPLCKEACTLLSLPATSALKQRDAKITEALADRLVGWQMATGKFLTARSSGERAPIIPLEALIREIRAALELVDFSD